MNTDTQEARDLSFLLQEATRAISTASEIADLMGKSGLATDLVIAMVTVQRARSEFIRNTTQTSECIRSHIPYRLV